MQREGERVCELHTQTFQNVKSAIKLYKKKNCQRFNQKLYSINLCLHNWN